MNMLSGAIIFGKGWNEESREISDTETAQCSGKSGIN